MGRRCVKFPGHPLERTFTVLLPTVLVAHVFGALVAPDLVWGASFYAFFPAWVLPVTGLALVAVCVLVLKPNPALERALHSLPDPRRWTPRTRILAAGASAVAAGIFFWTFRIRHTLLGDGNGILLSLPSGDRVHPREPLTVAWNARLYAWVRSWGPENRAPDLIAESAVALGSVLAGMLFVLVAWGLASELVRMLPHDPRSAQRTTPLVWLTAALLMTQGYVQLFFGYVEYYTPYLLVLGVFTWLALRHSDGRAPLLAPVLAALLAFGLHLSGGVVAPALAYLVFEALRRPDRRRSALRDVGLAVVAVAGLALGLARLGGGYDLFESFVRVFREEVVQGGVGSEYFGSWRHLRDFLDEQLLIGPFGLVLFLPAVVVAARARGFATPAARFLLVLGATYLGASWVAGDANLGYARNWDLLAPAGLVFASAGLAFFYARSTRSHPRPAWLLCAVALSIFHTAPWIGLNASEVRGVARMARLPLGGGRSQTAVGTWHMRRGDDAQAIVWFRKALVEDPRNPNALQMLGLVFVKQGRMDAAADAFLRASALRPDKPDYRNNVVEALNQLGRFEEALPHLAWLCEQQPEVFRHWQLRVESLLQLGRNAEAQRVLERALEVFTLRQKRHPAEYGSNFDLGLVFLGLDRPAEALACFERALRADPRAEAALYNASAMLFRLGRGSEARPHVEGLLRSQDAGIREQARAWLQELGG